MTPPAVAGSLLVALVSVQQAPPTAPWRAEVLREAAAPRLRVPDAGLAAEGGTRLVQRLAHSPRPTRQDALAEALLAGQLPGFLRALTPVTYTAMDGSGVPRRVELAVTSDYLAVGTDADFVRVALDRTHAERVAAAMGGLLPTRFLVDRIYEAAAVTVAPQPIPPCAQMVGLPWLLKHRGMLADQGLIAPSHALRAGHKKDVVLTRRLAAQPDRVAIYGWHRSSGQPIQPLSLFHGHTYADYSHGVRVVSRAVRVDGVEMDLVELLVDPLLAPLVSDEGPLPRGLVLDASGQAS